MRAAFFRTDECRLRMTAAAARRSNLFYMTPRFFKSLLENLPPHNGNPVFSKHTVCLMIKKAAGYVRDDGIIFFHTDPG